MNRKFFVAKLLDWYNINKRDLPWRKTSNTYKIWLSEVILQQTRVQQGLPYYERFIRQYPKVSDLAAAPEKEILRLWQGLGYYSRAKNLHACSQMIMEEFQGEFPESYKKLLNLKGVGKYTAAAIASFAYHEKVPVVDGNVFRVLSRIFGLSDDIGSGKGQKKFFALAESLLPDKESHIYNQAIMEFGALQCTPGQPLCDGCPFGKNCFANRKSMQGLLPVKQKKPKIKNRYFHYFILHYENKVWMNERKGKDIWRGLYDFYLVEEKEFKNVETIRHGEIVETIIQKNGILRHEPRTFKHVLTHQHIYARFFHVDICQGPALDALKSSAFYTLEEIEALPKPILIDKYLKEGFF